MKKMYQAPNLTYIKFTEDAVTTSNAKPYNFGDGDWGVEDDFV